MNFLDAGLKNLAINDKLCYCNYSCFIPRITSSQILLANTNGLRRRRSTSIADSICNKTKILCEPRSRVPLRAWEMRISPESSGLVRNENYDMASCGWGVEVSGSWALSIIEPSFVFEAWPRNTRTLSTDLARLDAI